MEVIGKIAKETFEKVSMNNKGMGPAETIDMFVLEYTRAVLVEVNEFLERSPEGIERLNKHFGV